MNNFLRQRAGCVLGLPLCVFLTASIGTHSVMGAGPGGLAAAWSVLAQADDLAALEEQAMQAAAERVASSMVKIENVGGAEQVDGQLLATGATTGLIVSEDGYILSSAFGFAGKPTSILVTLPSGKRTSATIVARDNNRMLVLLKAITDEQLTVPEVAPRDQLTVGQWTLALGRTYPGPAVNMSVGVLSAINRIWGKAVQTDAKVSPSNYGGPLVDIHGRVIGILVPLSPQEQGEMAGAEWYDSGIGFAVPLSDVLPQLETLKAGQNLTPGLIGISLKGTDMYGTPVVIAACEAKSPAREAGLQVGDTIVEIDGMKIERQAQLRHAIGPRVAGDTIHIVVERGESKERFEADLKLVAELEPYVRPELGILPVRGFGAGPATEGTRGVVIRAVLPGSPAATAGLQAGDRITGVNELEIADATALRDAIIAFDPGTEVTVKYQRAEQTASASVKLAPQSTAIPDELPPPHQNVETAPGELPAVGTVEIQIPEVANKCVAYVPETYNPAIRYGLLVWLHAPGQFDQAELINLWKPLCDQYEMILLAPQAADVRRWTSTEIEFVRKTMDDVVKRYSIDPARVVLHGYLAGGAMAYHVAFGNRDVCRAVAAANAPLPMRVGHPTTDPVQPMSIYSFSSEQTQVADAIKAGEERLKKKAFPLITVAVPGPERYLTGDELTHLMRWLDALDRI